MELRYLLEMGEKILIDAGVVDAKVDAKILLYYKLHYTDKDAFMHWTKDLSYKHCDEYLDLIHIRAAGMPVQYITNVQNFYGIDLYVDERVLIPRSDTENLVERVLDIANKEKKTQIMDMCTGSGAIAIALVNAKKDIKITAVDVSEEVLAVAKKNAEKTGTKKNISFIKSDMFSSIKKGKLTKKYDIIVSNPPYVPSNHIDELMVEVKDHEPHLALDGGEDGLFLYKTLIKQSLDYLKKNGVLALEIGYDQAESIKDLVIEFGSKFKEPEILKDLSGNDRVAILRLSNNLKEK